jgi:probable addiction module antidote protein
MTIRSSSYREEFLEALIDRSEAAHYVNAALQESLESFLMALRDVAQANQMAKVAKDAGVKRETLYRSLSEQGNPTLETFWSVLHALGLRFKIDVDSVGTEIDEPPLSAHLGPSATRIRTQDQALNGSDQEWCSAPDLIKSGNANNFVSQGALA